MLLNIRAFGVSVAVICFFCVGFVGWAAGLSAFLCCKRAMTAAFIGYLAGLLIERVIYTIIYDKFGNENEREMSDPEITEQQQEVN